MSKTSQANVSAQFSGDGWPNAQPWTSGPIANNPSPTELLQVTLVNGTVSFAVPAGTLWVLFMPSATGLTKTVKTVSGDTGIRIHPTQPTLICFDPAAVPALVYVTATAAETLPVMLG